MANHIASFLGHVIPNGSATVVFNWGLTRLMATQYPQHRVCYRDSLSGSFGRFWRPASRNFISLPDGSDKRRWFGSECRCHLHDTCRRLGFRLLLTSQQQPRKMVGWIIAAILFGLLVILLFKIEGIAVSLLSWISG